MVYLDVHDEPLQRGVARVVRLTDTGRRNALTPVMLDALEAALDGLRDGTAPVVLILTHDGPAFCSGTDLAALESVLSDEEDLRRFLSRIVALFRRLERLELPTIAAIDGAAVGGGFELALACDFRILSPASWVSLPEVTLGAVPGGGGAHRLPRLLGRARTLELTLTGQRLAAQRCEQLGLCRELSEGSVVEQALELASTLASFSGPAMAAIKQLVLDSEDAPAEHADRLAVDAMVTMLLSRDGQEGLKAVRERRTPRFVEPAPLRGPDEGGPTV